VGKVDDEVGGWGGECRPQVSQRSRSPLVTNVMMNRQTHPAGCMEVLWGPEKQKQSFTKNVSINASKVSEVIRTRFYTGCAKYNRHRNKKSQRKHSTSCTQTISLRHACCYQQRCGSEIDETAHT
jgi:hypothetical protein